MARRPDRPHSARILKFELIGLDDAEQAALEREAAEFNRCCRVLGWRP